MKPLTSRLKIGIAAAILAAGCATQAGQQASAAGEEPAIASASLELDPPARGFQIETAGLMIDVGDDIRWCEVVRVPGDASDVYYVDRIEAAMTSGAQDLIVSAARVGSETEAIMDVGSRVPCTRAGEAFGEDLAQLTATQHLYDDHRFPEGVGKVVHGGQKIAIDYHYVGLAESDAELIPAKVKVNFHAVDEAAVRQVAHTANFHNLTIYTPPGGQSSHLAECMVDEEVLVGELARRTQARGTGFSVWLRGGERDGELIWYSADPNDSVHELLEPMRLLPGEGFRFQCDYQNNTDLELRFGVNATDEMCTLAATVWSPEEGTEPSPQGCLLLDVDHDGIARD
ncbi:MAG: hypothetical protein OXT09_15065 [Myxococcales bacterium]|nr:hypothetical protein [Myxococcales bacterium]